MPVLFPPPLSRGATFVVVAPSGPFDVELLHEGLRRISNFEMSLGPQLLERKQGYFAGSDEERLAELQNAFDSDEFDGILIARGGYGLGRIVERLDLTKFLTSPKWVVGFSDATVLHALLWKHGVASLHAPNVTSLAQATIEEVQVLTRALLRTDAPRFQLQTLRSGHAHGPLFGGNLTVLFTEAAAGRLRIPEGAILFLEDVTETSYRVDRMLNALLAGGYFQSCSGLVFGEFTDCSAGKFDVPVEAVLAEFTQHLTIPSALGMPIGHGSRNYPVVLGVDAELDLRRGGCGWLQLSLAEN